jgi:hypothetical protein
MRIIADSAHHEHRRTEAMRGDRLVGAFTAWETANHGVGYGLTGLRKVFHTGNDIEVDRTDYRD